MIFFCLKAQMPLALQSVIGAYIVSARIVRWPQKRRIL